ncbi:hypothetical protein HBB16_09465 [Pseudonocardia sp. MCCB 268]|nr:hypothetical protein [Pseudonocardia cytotoxica]
MLGAVAIPVIPLNLSGRAGPAALAVGAAVVAASGGRQDRRSSPSDAVRAPDSVHAHAAPPAGQSHRRDGL